MNRTIRNDISKQILLPILSGMPQILEEMIPCASDDTGEFAQNLVHVLEMPVLIP